MSTRAVAPIELAVMVRDRLAQKQGEFLELLTDLVAIDSGQDAPDGIAKVGDLIANRLEHLPGVTTERRHEGDVSHVAVTIPGGGGPVALLGHADTVFPLGSVAERPIRIEGDLCFGPGVADMKGGLAMGVLVCEELHRIDANPTIHFVIVGDEETRVVPPPFMDRLSTSRACLVLECGRPGGGYVVRRKGGFWARLEAHGRSAHAGVQPDRGDSAIVRLSRAILDVTELGNARSDLTLSVGTVAGGAAPNVIAEKAHADVDVRAFDHADLEWARQRIEEIGEIGSIAIHETGRWPPMTPGDDRLSLAYQETGHILGVPLAPLSTGGMSDGCWVASAGVPTVDGVGPEGDDDHSPREYLDLASVPARAGSLAGAITRNLDNGGTE